MRQKCLGCLGCGTKPLRGSKSWRRKEPSYPVQENTVQRELRGKSAGHPGHGKRSHGLAQGGTGHGELRTVCPKTVPARPSRASQGGDMQTFPPRHVATSSGDLSGHVLLEAVVVRYQRHDSRHSSFGRSGFRTKWWRTHHGSRMGKANMSHV